MEIYYGILFFVACSTFIVLTVLRDRKDYFKHFNKSCK